MANATQFWDQPDVKQLRDRAEAAEAAGDHDAALAAWDALVAAHPDAIGGWSVRGQFLERRRRLPEALASYQRSVQVRPNYPDHYNAGSILLQLDRLDEALAALDASIECHDGYAQAWCNRGIALFRLQRTAEARASFERAEAIDHRLANAFRCHAILLDSIGERAAAVAKRKRVCELEPASATSHLAYAKALGDTLDPKQILWKPGGPEDQIVDALDAALALRIDDRQQQWAWAEKLTRLQRIAHGRQASRRAGLPGVDDASAIARYATAAEAAAALYPDDAWFQDHTADARDLA